MANLYLGLGSNQGARLQLMQRALELLEERIGRVVGQSALYETKPWGFVSDHPFLNAVVAIQTDLEPLQVLDVTQKIERDLGRRKKSAGGHYSDRTMDIDLIFYDDRCLDLPDLVLPHPQMHLRDFVLRPMAELAPDFVHPVLGKTMTELFQTLLREEGEKTIINP